MRMKVKGYYYVNRANTYDKAIIYLWESKDGINYKETNDYTPEQFKDKYLKESN